MDLEAMVTVSTVSMATATVNIILKMNKNR